MRFLTTLSVLLGLVACAALAAGMYLWLDEIYPARQALLIFGAGGVVIASITGSVTYAIAHWRRIKMRVAKKVVERKVHSLFDAIADEFEVPVQLYPKTAAAAAALAGIVIGEKVGEKGARVMRELVAAERSAGRAARKSLDGVIH